MSVRKNPFGPVWGASGVQGFFGEGYAFHRALALVPGFNFDGMTFVAKTATIEPREGNMPLDGIIPRERFPKCVWANHRKGIALNAVGLSNPGVEVLLCCDRWQERTDPFQISFMSLESTAEARLTEWGKFLNAVARCLPGLYENPIGIQKNESCPNVGTGLSHFEEAADEIRAGLDMAAELQVTARIVIKLSANFPPEKAKDIAEHPLCWGICISNTIPWRARIPWLPHDHQIDWDGLFGESNTSPLNYRGLEQPGGLSGKPLVPIVCEWIRAARFYGVECHINGGGGILSPRDVESYVFAGADSVFLGSIAFLRPWRVQGCIRRAHFLLA
jgi:dihydroorotate dehydrogenase